MNESVVKKAKVTEEIKQATDEDYTEDSSPEFYDDKKENNNIKHGGFCGRAKQILLWRSMLSSFVEFSCELSNRRWLSSK